MGICDEAERVIMDTNSLILFLGILTIGTIFGLIGYFAEGEKKK